MKPIFFILAFLAAAADSQVSAQAGSRPLMKLAEQFEAANKNLLDLSADWLGEMKGPMLQPDLETPVAKKMKALAEEIRVRKQALVEQMRTELGSDKL